MDERQQNIEVGAGLQESRINQELLDWLNKWGSWILTGVLIIVLAYLGYIKYGEYQASRRDKAFASYMETRGTAGAAGVLSGSPDNLITLAEDKAGIGSVSHLARLDAAEIYLGWARLGLKPGSISDTNPEPAEEDVLSAEAEAEMYTTSYDLYKRVATDTASDEAHALFRLKALWGMAAASASLGEFDRATAEYESVQAFAGEIGLPDIVQRADNALASIDDWQTPLTIYSEDDLPPDLRPIDPNDDFPARPVLDDAFQGGGPVRIGPEDSLLDVDAEILPVEPEASEEEGGNPVTSEDPSGQ